MKKARRPLDVFEEFTELMKFWCYRYVAGDWTLEELEHHADLISRSLLAEVEA